MQVDPKPDVLMAAMKTWSTKTSVSGGCCDPAGFKSIRDPGPTIAMNVIEFWVISEK